MTYRTGNHQARNLYRGNEYIGVMFDPADAALIVDALEGTPDVDHARGATEALALVRHLLDRAAKPDEQLFAATIHQMLRDAAAELGVDADAPSARVGSTETAQNASGVHGSGVDVPDQPRNCPGTGQMTAADPTPERIAEVAARRASLFTHPDRRCICNDPPPTVIGRDGKKNGTATRPPGWACPRHGQVI